MRFLLALALVLALPTPAHADEVTQFTWDRTGAEHLPCTGNAEWELSASPDIMAVSVGINDNDGIPDGTAWAMLRATDGSWHITATQPVALDDEILVAYIGTATAPKLALTGCDSEAPPPATTFQPASCTRVLGFSQTHQWYIDGGFEAQVDPDAWELYWHGGGTIGSWGNPRSIQWTRGVVEQPSCIDAPDRAILNVGHTHEYTDVEWWVNGINAALPVIREKLPSVTTIVLQAIVGGPGTCYLKSGVTVNASVIHPSIVQAIAEVANGGDVLVGADLTVPDCAMFKDFRGHLKTAGSQDVAEQVAAFYQEPPATRGPPQHAPCRERSWIPRTGMPTAEKEWRFVRLVDCAVKRWWPGHTRTVLDVAWRESHYNTYAVSPSGSYVTAFQHALRYWPGRRDLYLRPEWFAHWPVVWTNARAQTIVTIRMMAAQGGVCPAWC